MRNLARSRHERYTARGGAVRCVLPWAVARPRAGGGDGRAFGVGDRRKHGTRHDGGGGAAAGAVALWQRGASQESTQGSEGFDEPGNSDAGREVHGAHTVARPGVHDCGGAESWVGDWRERGGVQRGEYADAAAAAVSECAGTGVDCATADEVRVELRDLFDGCI